MYAFKRLLIMLFLFLSIAWLSSTYLSVISSGDKITLFLYRIISDLTKISFELGKTLFDFWFMEIFLGAFLIVGSYYLLFPVGNGFDATSRNDRENIFHYTLFVLMIFIVFEVFVRNDLLRVRHIAPIIICVIFWTIFRLQKFKFMHILDSDLFVNRLSISLLIGILILLSISPLFWRNLIDSRFLQIYIPYLLLIIYLKMDKIGIYLISVIFLISGAFYLSSNRISDFYQPPSYNKDIPIIFQDESCYSTQYIKHGMNILKEPFILDPYFEKYCRICRMGKKDINFSNYNKIWIIGRYNFDPELFLPFDFKLIKKIEHLTWLDKLQFKYLTPIYPRHYATFEYNRVK